MTDQFSFERYWLAKLAASLNEMVDPAIKQAMMEGSDALAEGSDRPAVIAWTDAAMARLDTMVDEETRQQIMMGCACQYPKAALQEIKHQYAETGDLVAAHRALQTQFEGFLRETLLLEDGLVREILGRGWGLAGVLERDRVVATKIPKSGNLRAYLAETDSRRKRELYCHCPRVREALQTDTQISATYCYCGAGYYRGIWEEITGRSVHVELLESVLAGGEVCRVTVDLG
jgi:hypothetical protein